MSRTACFGRRLEALPLTYQHLVVAGVCGLGLAVEIAEVTAGNALSAVFSVKPYAFSPSSLAWVLAGAYLGAIAGAPLVGRLAQRIGRRHALQLSLAYLAVTSVILATVSTPFSLGLLRLLSGVALGAYPPVMISYLTEIAPGRSRGKLIFFTCTVAYLGPPIAIFTMNRLTPVAPFGVEGWRWLFIGSGIISFAGAGAFALVPESPRWLMGRGLFEAADSVYRRLERSRPIFKSTARPLEEVATPADPNVSARGIGRPLVFVSTLYWLHPWATSAFPLLTGPLLLERGLRLPDTLFYVGMATLGPVVSTFCTSAFVDRFKRRNVLVSLVVLMLSSVFAFFASSESAILTLSVIAFGIGIALYTAVMHVYGAELFPTSSRASAIASAWALNRLAAAIVPLASLYLLRSGGPLMFQALVCTALVASAFLLARWGPAGRSESALE